MVSSPVLDLTTSIPGDLQKKRTKHTMTTTHLSRSNHIFLSASWVSRFIFKWTNSLFCCRGYHRHFHLQDYNCPSCPSVPCLPLSSSPQRQESYAPPPCEGGGGYH